MIVIVMGVSGCGKTTIGRQLAEQLAWPFYEGDDFHPPANVERMRAGIPLTDDDRRPWLSALAKLIHQLIAQNRSAVLSCSALKAVYRHQLQELLLPSSETTSALLKFVYLKLSLAEAQRRVAARTAHFMPAALVDSQFAALEEPIADGNTLILPATAPTSNLIQQICQTLCL